MIDFRNIESFKAKPCVLSAIQPAMTPSLLPPYLPFQGIPSGAVGDNYFRDILLHPTLSLTVQREYYDSGETTGWHRHMDFLSLYAVRRGRGVHWIDQTPYGLTKGDIYLLAPGATHRYCDYADLEIDAFYFQTELFQAAELKALRELAGFWRLFVGDGNVEHRIHLTPEEWHEAQTQIEAIRSEWSERSLAGCLLLRQELFRLLVALARRLDKRRPLLERAKPSISGMAEAIRFCEENLDKPLTVPHLAARFFLSTGHFSELFGREAGMPPAAYLRHIRLEKARSLLATTTLPVTQVALQCGFGDPTHFSRIFRDHYQISPMQYRKQARIR